MEKKSVPGTLKSLIIKRSNFDPNKKIAKPIQNFLPILRDLSKYELYKYTGKSTGHYHLALPSKRLKEEKKWTGTVHEVNSEVFGHKVFKLLQEEIINSVLEGNDALVLMPTGAGKSLTYQLPAVVTKGLTIVVEPLLSLMSDQTTKLLALGINVKQFNSNLNVSEQSQVLNELEEGTKVKLLYITPEKLAHSDRLLQVLDKIYAKNNLARLVVDEAHCVCQWGNEFRPDYLKLKNFRTRFPGVPILALTACGTRNLQIEISKLLALKEPTLFSSGFNRPNLFYEIRNKNSQINTEIAKFIINKHLDETGIVYCNFIKDCETLSKVLKHNYKINCEYYHGELSIERKETVYNKWISGDIKVIIATIAFGLGIDKENVRFVVHYSLPESLELYYQETGRAGRDNGKSDCLLFYQYEDKAKIENLVSRSQAKDIDKVIEYCENCFTCRRKMMLEYMGEDIDDGECNKMCDNCCADLTYVEMNVQPYTEIILNDLSNQRCMSLTLLQLTELLKGSNSRAQSHLKGCRSFSLLKSWKKQNIERFLKMLIYSKVLVEEKNTLSFGGFYYKLRPGPLADSAVSGNLSLFMKFKENFANGNFSEDKIAENMNSDISESMKLIRKRKINSSKIEESGDLSNLELDNLKTAFDTTSKSIGNECLSKAESTPNKSVFSLDLDLLENLLEDDRLKRIPQGLSFASKKIKRDTN